MSARRRLAASAAILVVAAAGLLAPSAANAADGDGLTTTWTGDTVYIAWDGTPRTSSTEQFLGVPVTAPGDLAVRTLMVSNDGPSGGTLRAWIVDVDLLDPEQAGTVDGVLQDSFYRDLTLAWRSASQSSQASFAALAAADRTPILQTHLSQGASTQLTVSYQLPITSTSGNAAQVGPREASFAVLLEIRGDEPSRGGGALAATGAQVLGVLGVAGAAVLAGLLLILIARRRRRADPARGAPDAR